jgi:hypothetical protein
LLGERDRFGRKMVAAVSMLAGLYWLTTGAG